MPTIRCDTCDAELSDTAVRDGWCEGCGKRIPEYLLHERKKLAAEAEPESPPTGEVVFHTLLRTRLTAFVLLLAASGVAWFIPIWVVTHPTREVRKQTESLLGAVFGGLMGAVVTSVAFGRLLAGRIVVGERELRHTRPFLGGLGPFVVTDVIPFAAVERFGFGFTPADTGLVVLQQAIPTLLLRAAGVTHRLVLQEYPDPDRVLTALRRRLMTPPESIDPGWLGLGKFR
jgi:hypothetical protein